jgi:hypothetical protein
MTTLIFVAYIVTGLWAEWHVGATGVSVLQKYLSRPAVGAGTCCLMCIGGAFPGDKAVGA